MSKQQSCDRYMTWQGSAGRYTLQTEEGDIPALAWAPAPERVARAKAGGRSWTFELSGMFRRKIFVREAGPGTVIGTVSISLSGGTKLRMAGGKTFEWTRDRIIGSGRTFSSSSGPLYYVSERWDKEPRWKGSPVGVTQEGLREPELPLLLLLGWFMIVERIDGPFFIGQLNIDELVNSMPEWA